MPTKGGSSPSYADTNKYKLVVGGVYPTNNSGDVELLELNGPKDVMVRFLSTGNIIKCYAVFLHRGEIKDLIYGRGYRVSSPTKLEGKILKVYDCWRRMLHRSHESWWSIHPTYTGTTVDPVWYNYDNFFNWYETTCEDSSWDLDKDLLNTGEPRYSPNSCCFLPEEVNKGIIFVTPKFRKKGGVFEFYFRGKYVTSSKDAAKLKPLYVAYKNAYVRSLVEKYPNLNIKILNALRCYTLVVDGEEIRRIL